MGGKVSGDTDDTQGGISKLQLSLSTCHSGRTAVRSGVQPVPVCQTCRPLCRLCLHQITSPAVYPPRGSSSGAGSEEKCLGENADTPGLKAELQNKKGLQLSGPSSIQQLGW